ncbi:unnamed protein product [Thlaspi arvense]|uniref:Uncharacterized protein n=1 Tax=Thlaspi arvense TaxID=13288 RepID=A0AAU9SN20_THLAR|nr:unnamed protein product [Thlaspi arvense]
MTWFKVENDTYDIYAKISFLPDTAVSAKDMSQPTPTQEIVAKDLHDYEWRFKHIFRDFEL